MEGRVASLHLDLGAGGEAFDAAHPRQQLHGLVLGAAPPPHAGGAQGGAGHGGRGNQIEIKLKSN